MEFGEMKRNTSNWSNFCMLLRRAGLTASAGLSCISDVRTSLKLKHWNSFAVLKNMLMRLKQFQCFISVYFTMCDGLYLSLARVKDTLGHSHTSTPVYLVLRLPRPCQLTSNLELRCQSSSISAFRLFYWSIRCSFIWFRMSSLRTMSFHVIPKSRHWNLWCAASSFLPARLYASAGNSDRNVSVHLSRAGIVSKRRKLAPWFLHHLVAPWF